MNEEIQKQELSFAHIYTIATKVKIKFEDPRVDDDSVDITLVATGKLDEDSIWDSPKLDLQAKSTTKQLIEENPEKDYFSFPLSIKNYNDLRANTQTKRLLVVYILPEEKNEWVNYCTDFTISKRCAYWCNLHGEPEVNNSSTVTVHIPKINIFSPENLIKLMTLISKGESLPNVL